MTVPVGVPKDSHTPVSSRPDVDTQGIIIQCMAGEMMAGEKSIPPWLCLAGRRASNRQKSGDTS